MTLSDLIKEGFSEKSIADELGIHPYRVKLAHEKGYNYTKRSCAKIHFIRIKSRTGYKKRPMA